MDRPSVRTSQPNVDSTTPVIVSGVLAGLTGATVGMVITAVAALFRGDGFFMPARLVAAAVMGPDALARESLVSSLLFGVLLTLVGAAAAGALFALMRRREPRTRLLVVEGVGYGLVMFAALHFMLPAVDPLMAKMQPRLPLAIAFSLFGACLSLEAPLRLGSLGGIRPSLA